MFCIPLILSFSTTGKLNNFVLFITLQKNGHIYNQLLLTTNVVIIIGILRLCILSTRLFLRQSSVVHQLNRKPGVLVSFVLTQIRKQFNSLEMQIAGGFEGHYIRQLRHSCRGQVDENKVNGDDWSGVVGIFSSAVLLRLLV